MIGMDVASSEFHTDDGMYDLDFKVCACVKLCKHSRRRDQLLEWCETCVLLILSICPRAPL